MDRKYLKQTIAQLKHLGQKWGLSTDDVSQSIEKALTAELSREKNDDEGTENVSCAENTISERIKIDEKTKRYKIHGVPKGIHPPKKRIFQDLLAILLCLGQYKKWVFGIVIGVVCLVATFLPVRLDVLLVPFLYDAMRLLRLVTLPLHYAVNISAFHQEMCLVSNPIFVAMDPGCGLCSRIKEIRIADNGEMASIIPIPILYRNVTSHSVNVTDIQRMVQENKPAVDQPTMLVTSTVPWLTSPADLSQSDLLEKIDGSPDFLFHWTNWDLEAGRLLRLLFPRPLFIPREKEVCLTKTLLIYGPESPAYRLKSAACLNSLVIVGSGTWRGQLMPPPSCLDRCHSFPVQLNPGDILTFPTNIFTLELHHRRNNTGVALIASYN